MLEGGWYLLSTSDLERELDRHRRGEPGLQSSGRRLSIEEALALRDAGNIPDSHGRSLRLVLRIDSSEELHNLDAKRRLFEPDYHESPTWRRAGSKPVNIVPLRAAGVAAAEHPAWWEQPEIAALEGRWQRDGTVEGISVSSEYRSFVYKTVIALRSAGRPVTIETIADSIERWLPLPDAQTVRESLERANSTPRPEPETPA